MNVSHCPLVGISILTYNYGRYIDDLIKSLREQTFQDFEVFLIDDGSSDGLTPEKIQNLSYEKISNKELFKKNLGNAIRRLNQYKKMSNKYILDLSADDKLSPTFLEKTVAYLEKHPRCGAVGTDIILFYDDSDLTTVTKFDPKYMTFEHILGKNHMLGSSLMRKKALDEADLSGGFIRYQDWDRWISIMEAGWELGLVSEPLFYYRQHQDSLSHSAPIASEMEIRNKILDKHRKAYEKNYRQVILDIYKNLLEVQEGKNWLEQQYFNMTKEIERLNSVIAELEKPVSRIDRIKKIIGIKK